MRGKVWWSSQKYSYQGITPAYAGKSSEDSGGVKYTMDHPRLCGEKVAIRKSREHRIGSPPPMRGKGKQNDQNRERGRITPAYAGKSFSFHEWRIPN